MTTTLSLAAAPSPSNEDIEPLNQPSENTHHLPNTALPASQPSPSPAPFNGKIGDDNDLPDAITVEPEISRPILNGHSPPLPNGRDGNLNHHEGPPVITNGLGNSQHHHTSEGRHVDVHAPSAINPTLPNSHLLLRAESVSEHDAREDDESSSEGKFDNRSYGSGQYFLGDDVDRRIDGPGQDLHGNEVDKRSNGSGQEMLDDEVDRKSDGSSQDLLNDEEVQWALPGN